MLRADQPWDVSRLSCVHTRTSLDPSLWPCLDVGALSPSVRRVYLARKSAIELYLRGAAADEIKEQTTISARFARRLLIDRCLEPHSDGGIWGWRALLPNVRLVPYIRKSPVVLGPSGGGCAGALSTLLLAHPQLRAHFHAQILAPAKKDSLGEINRTARRLWGWFLGELRILGYEIRNEWPFTTQNMGYSTGCRYIKAVRAESPEKGAAAVGGPEGAKKMKTGDGVDRPVKALLQRVEMDAHKTDGRFCIMYPALDGSLVARIVHRLWVIVIIEVVSRAVLGYYLSTRKEVNSEDVLRALKSALTRWQKQHITFGDAAYSGQAGFPSALSESYVGLCWDEMSVDGALAETCESVRAALKDIVGSTLISPERGFSCDRSPDNRPFIEAFFKTLAGRGLQRMSNTTGANPKALQGRNPDRVAVTGQFQIEYARELLDVLIANYNGRSHSGLGYRSPLQYFEFLYRPAEPRMRRADPQAVESILSFKKLCRVVGGYEKGRRPFVHFIHGRYSNQILEQRHDLVGKMIWVTNHLEEDSRVARAATLDGKSLGILRAQAPWSGLPHSLSVRRAIVACANRELFSLNGTADGVQVFMDFVESQPKKKLPVHPAYLEVRRILENHVKEFNQATLSLNGEEPDAPQSRVLSTGPVAVAKSQEKEGISIAGQRPLPVRRMAAD